MTAAQPTPEWMTRGLCAQTDPEQFFPDPGAQSRAAKAVCSHCPVRAECLEYAIEHDERWGVWGGLSERERRPLVRARGSRCARCGAPAGPVWRYCEDCRAKHDQYRRGA
jgi:WhiB family transcriptional regulator, redox-sensing transcriptional regulator